MLSAHARLSAMLSILLVFSVGPARLQAEAIYEVTGEFEVSGTSQLYAGAMGLAPVDVDGQSRILVTWHQAPVPGGGFEYDGEIVPPLDYQTGVFVNTYSLAGVSLRDTIRVDEPGSPGWPMGPILAADAQGRFVVVWRQAQENNNRLDYSIWMRPFDTAGKPLADAKMLAHETDALPSIDMAPSGEFVIVLGRTAPVGEMNFDQERPQFLFFDADFLPKRESPYLVDTSLEMAYSLLSAVSLNGNGELAIAYVDASITSFDRVRRLRLRTFSSDGSAISQPVEVESSTVWGLSVQWLNNEHFVVAWMDGGRYADNEGKWQVFDKTGQAVSPLFGSDRARGWGGILKKSEAEFAIAWTTESGPVLIGSTLETQMAEVPLNVSNRVLPHSFIDYSVGNGFESNLGLPLSVASLETGQFAAVWMNRVDQREQVRAEVFTLGSEDSMAVFESAAEGPCIADRTATVRLSWSSGFDYLDIYVAGPPTEKLFARVRGTGEISTGLWARLGMAFLLVDPSTQTLVATVKADIGPDTCPLSPLLVGPDVIEVCDPLDVSSTEVLWDVTDTSISAVDVRVNGIEGKLFARGGKLGSAATGEWLRNDTIFYLLEAYTTDLLGTAASEYQQVRCN